MRLRGLLLDAFVSAIDGHQAVTSSHAKPNINADPAQHNAQQYAPAMALLSKNPNNINFDGHY